MGGVCGDNPISLKMELVAPPPAKLDGLGLMSLYAPLFTGAGNTVVISSTNDIRSVSLIIGRPLGPISSGDASGQ